MKKYIFLLLLTISFSAHSGLADWEKLPRQYPQIKIEKKFDTSFWVVQGIKIDPEKYDGENIKKIAEKNGNPNIYENRHHKFICIKNKSTYLHVYDSGWGPGYSLTNTPFVDAEKCKDIKQPITLGSGLFIGMKKTEIERKLGKTLPDKVTDLRYEEVMPSESCKSGIWHAVDLKVIFKNQHVSGIYFDDHGEPNGPCQ